MSNFRRFMILSTCQSYMPKELLTDDSAFPERSADLGAMYVEAEDKVTLTKVGEIQFARANKIIGAVYNSKSGRTKLRWTSVRGELGKLSGEASGNALVNLITAAIIESPNIAELGPTDEVKTPLQT